ncbi:MAG: DUF2157 domain-containing protein [Clostridiales bacterium]|nr:DUF2157 domain-containing protein [Clostridiales bacterium]
MRLNTLDWLHRESAQWVADGLITSEQRALIEARYPAKRAGSPLLLLFAILGALLIGAGILLVFATNWWRLPVGVKVLLAFLPLVSAQLLCLYIWVYKNQSVPFREGGALFLSLAFFAAVALIEQIFHQSSSLDAYVLRCILFTLPGLYLFRAKAAMAIYVAGAIFVGWSQPEWVPVALTAAVLPFFWLELRASSAKGVVNYLLLLLSTLLSGTLLQSMQDWADPAEVALTCGLALLLLDALLRRFGRIYLFSAAKRLAILCITATLLLTSLDVFYVGSAYSAGTLCAVGVAAAYAALRYLGRWPLFSSDLFALSAVVLVLSRSTGVVASLLVTALGIYYVVLGSRTLALSKLNYGMGLIISLIAIRFFDSRIDLLIRGVVFILLGVALLGVNLYISHERRRRSA